jgi:superfamily II DNA/RNA helicase
MKLRGEDAREEGGEEEISVVTSKHITPITRFQGNFISEQVLENMRAHGISEPTVVQRYSVPVGLRGEDILVCAPTGMGKTLAFLLPTLNSLLGARVKRRAPRALILTPTRELAVQIAEDAAMLSRGTGIRSRAVYGGDNRREQVAGIKGGVDILVGTPGRVTDFLENRIVSIDSVDMLVFDEADRMLDMGFEPQIRSLLKYLDGERERQTMMFSATFPKSLQEIAREFFQKEFVEVSIGEGTIENITQEIVEIDSSAAKRNSRLLEILEKVKYRVSEPVDRGVSLEWKKPSLVWKKQAQTGQPVSVHNKDTHSTRSHDISASPRNPGGEGTPNILLNAFPKVVVFVETKRQCDELEAFLLGKGIPCISIHGDRSQSEREDALSKFRLSEKPVLVATSVAARGLDIPGIELVVNYKMPSDVKEYVHRIGRTGRAGHTGRSITFFGPEDRAVAAELVEVIRSAKQEPPCFLEETALPKKLSRKRFGKAVHAEQGGHSHSHNGSHSNNHPGSSPGTKKREWAREKESLKTLETEVKEKLSIKDLDEWADDS